jgi:hypothetical protein
MQMTSTRAALVGINDLDAEFAAVTATIPRAEVEEAARAEEPPELVLEVQRQGEADGAAAVSVEWKREDLERLLRNTTGDKVTLVFRRDQLEEAVSTADVEAHGLRERMLVLTVAAATAAAAGSSIASAAPDSGVGPGQGTAAVSAVHDEAGLTTRGIEAMAGHDEASLASRGIEAQQVAASHDEASLASRGITPAGTHDEASLASRGIEAPQVAASHDEASLASRGITPAGTHDEASLASRGIEVQPVPATHDEASLVSRGIVEAPAAVHDEASLAARGIETPPAPADTGFEFPTVDATTAAVATGVGGGIALLITAAGFAARRERMRPA